MTELELITYKLKIAYIMTFFSFVSALVIFALWYQDHSFRTHVTHAKTLNFDVSRMNSEASILYQDGLKQLNFMGYKGTIFSRGSQKYVYSLSTQDALEREVYKCSTLGFRSIVFKSDSGEKEELSVYCQSL